MARSEALEAKLKAVAPLLAALPAVATPPARAGAETCDPTIAADGRALLLSAPAGPATFKSDKCGSADLCQMAQATRGVLEALAT